MKTIIYAERTGHIVTVKVIDPNVGSITHVEGHYEKITLALSNLRKVSKDYETFGDGIATAGLSGYQVYKVLVNTISYYNALGEHLPMDLHLDKDNYDMTIVEGKSE